MAGVPATIPHAKFHEALQKKFLHAYQSAKEFVKRGGEYREE
jgi:hypothetical protein